MRHSRTRLALPPYVWLSISTVGALGLAIRLASIRSSLWLDEFSTLWAVESGFVQMLHRVPAVMGQSPLYFAFAWLSVHLFGESELALRLPSLLAIGAATVFVCFAANWLRDAKAALWAAALFWMSYPAIWESVDARPYGLALLCAAVAVFGLVRTCLAGRLVDRAWWIFGAAALIWTHYIFAPFVGGLIAACLVQPALRRAYPPSRVLLDLGAIAVVLAPAAAQLHWLAAHPGEQQWLFQPSPLAVAGLVAPFLLTAWFPEASRIDDHVHHAMRRMLLAAIVFQLGALFVAAAAGTDLLDARYGSVVIVAAAVLSGDRLSGLVRTDSVAPIAIYVLVTALTLAATRETLGSFSGEGFQQWREAVAALRPEVAAAPNATVLYRSGNAEDDLFEPGEIGWPATLAPLRSPGQSAPQWNIAPLTYRWNTDRRSRYFSGPLAARIGHEDTFFLLCQSSSEPGANGYCRGVISWIRGSWPARFKEVSLGSFRSVTVMRFDRAR